MAVFKRGNVWWYEFVFTERRIRESAKTSRKTIAVESERNRRLELEKTLSGMSIEKRENRIRSVSGVVTAYEGHYSINHRAKSVAFSTSRLAHVKRLLGTALLPDLTEDAIRSYVKTRLVEGVGGRTINMELRELSRAIGHKWSVLWPKVRKLEEERSRQGPIAGRRAEATGHRGRAIITEPFSDACYLHLDRTPHGHAGG
jgi:hypothetical protein